MFLIQCDRCSKPIQEGDGYRFDIYNRTKLDRNSTQGIIVPPSEWLQGEICDGCYSLLHFFFREKFREDTGTPR